MEQSFKISLLRSPRYILFVFVIAIIFCVMLFLYHLSSNILFLIISGLTIFVLSFFVVVLGPKLKHKIFVYSDKITFEKSKGETDTFYFRDVKVVGFYKKELLSDNFKFGDGLYLYCDKNDKYVLMGIGFKNYRLLYREIKSKSQFYNLKWLDIERKKGVFLVEELQNLLNNNWNTK